MSGWAPKRFWKVARTEPAEGGFTVRLDGRAVKTPAKAALVVPTLALAEAIAAEWDAQEGTVRPETMPFTRAANSAIDKVVPQLDEVRGLIAAYGGSDLLCYRAEGAEALAARQAAGWDPVLGWAATQLGAPLMATAGVMHIAQPEQSLARLTGAVAAFSAFELAALHDLVALSGSLVLALAVTDRHLPADEAWRLSRIDEDWQAELWGIDEEAAESAALKKADFLRAARFFELCRLQSFP